MFCAHSSSTTLALTQGLVGKRWQSITDSQFENLLTSKWRSLLIIASKKQTKSFVQCWSKFEVQGKVCIWVNQPTRSELIPLSIPWSNWKYLYSPWMGCYSTRGLLCSIKFSDTHLWRGERCCESKVSCPRTQHNVPGQDRNPDHLIWRWVH